MGSPNDVRSMEYLTAQSKLAAAIPSAWWDTGQLQMVSHERWGPTSNHGTNTMSWTENRWTRRHFLVNNVPRYPPALVCLLRKHGSIALSLVQESFIFGSIWMCDPAVHSRHLSRRWLEHTPHAKHSLWYTYSKVTKTPRHGSRQSGEWKSHTETHAQQRSETNMVCLNHIWTPNKWMLPLVLSQIVQQQTKNGKSLTSDIFPLLPSLPQYLGFVGIYCTLVEFVHKSNMKTSEISYTSYKSDHVYRDNWKRPILSITPRCGVLNNAYKSGKTQFLRMWW